MGRLSNNILHHNASTVYKMKEDVSLPKLSLGENLHVNIHFHVCDFPNIRELITLSTCLFPHPLPVVLLLFMPPVSVFFNPHALSTFTTCHTNSLPSTFVSPYPSMLRWDDLLMILSSKFPQKLYSKISYSISRNIVLLFYEELPT